MRGQVRQLTASVFFLSSTLAAQNVITTVAGIDPSFTGNGQQAVNVPIGYINGVATDGSGNVYFTDPLEHLVLKVSSTGILSVVAGNGIAAYSGDGGPATQAAVAATDNPVNYVGPPGNDALGGIAVDPLGNVYFADGNYVRLVASDGTISTVAGGGTNTPGNGMPATQVSLGIVNGLALDSAGNLYFSENNRIRKVSGGILTTYAGTGPNGYSGDGGPATSAQLSQPLGLAFDAQNNLYVADGDVTNNPTRIRRIGATDGKIVTVAGGGSAFPKNGAAPLTLDLSYASGLAVDPSGTIYVFAPNTGHLMKFVNGSTTLLTSTVANVFQTNLPATSAYVVGRRAYDNSGIALDASGNLYVADSRDGYLCKIDTHGTFTAIAGNGAYGFGGDGGPALSALIEGPTAMTQTPDGTVYLLDTLNARVRAISPSGTISTVLSSTIFPPLGAQELLNGITSDPKGNVYVLLKTRIVEIAPNGSVSIVLNNAGTIADGGDGGAAIDATIQSGGGLTRDSAGNIYLSDPFSNRIRKITTDGKIHSIAGNGNAAFSPDGTFSVGAPVSGPTTVLADNVGGLYFEESPTGLSAGNLIRYITPGGYLKTIAGNGQPGYSGDGGPATQASLFMQNRAGLALDKAGNLYIADGFNSVVRVVTPNQVINTIAGSGVAASAGDGGLAKNASIYTPRGLLFDAEGDLLISDVSANRIREVLATPPTVTAAPAQMVFTAKAGGARTAPQQLNMSSPVTGLGFTVTVSPPSPWLVIGTTAGLTPQIINVRADPSNLAPGPYQASITITTPLATPTNATVNVSLQVNPATSPKLAADTGSLSFAFPRTSTSAETQQLTVANAGTGNDAFTATTQTVTGGAWLKVGTASGTVTPQAPVNINVTANPVGLATGTYTGTVTLTGSGSGDSVTVDVTMTVSSLDQAIQLSHAGLSFTAVASGGIVPPGSFSVSNIGRGTANFTVSTRTLSGGQQWLSATPSSGSVAAGSQGPLITVSVDQTNLNPGFYYGLVRVDAPGSANTPQVLTVALRVLPSSQDPGPAIVPNQIVFHAVQGQPPPGSMNVSIYNIASTPLSYVSSAVASNASDQFRFIPVHTTLSPSQPTQMVIQPLTSALSPGVYTGDITLQFSDGFIRRIGIRTIVTPAPAGTQAKPSDVTATAPCTPTQLVPAITTLGQSFGVPAAWPVSIEALVRDDCGNTFDSGSVKVSFSNGDAPLSLLAVQGGMWHTTWLSGNGSGPVTLTVTATNPTQNLTGTLEITGGLGDPAPAPVLNGVVSNASFAKDIPLAPSSIISLFGQNLANGSGVAASLPLGTTLAGSTVVMAGVALPIFHAFNGQIDAVAISGVNANTNQQILVQRDNTISLPISVNVAPSAPAIYSYPLPGDPPTQGAIVNAVTNVVAQPGTPVTAGNYVAIYCTGLGPVDQKVPDGVAAPSSPPANTINTPTVTIGGKPATVTFSGLAPGYTGLYQIDAQVPGGITPGNQVPVVISISGQTSPPLTIALK